MKYDENTDPFPYEQPFQMSKAMRLALAILLFILCLILAGHIANGATTFDVPAGTSIQDQVNRASRGDTVRLLDGNFTGDVRIRPSSSGITITALHPTQVVMRDNYDPTTGAYVSTTRTLLKGQSTIQGYILAEGTTTDVLLDGLCQSNVRNYLQNNNAAVRTNSGWTIQNCLFEDNTGQAVALYGTGILLRNNVYRNNGHNGFGGEATQNATITGGWVQNNNCGITNPPWAGQPDTVLINGKWYVVPAWEAGGDKFSRSNNIRIIAVDCFANHGAGHWFDYQNKNSLIRDCIVYGNVGVKANWEGNGCAVEISDGPAEITNCLFYDNTGSGAAIWESYSVNIHDNWLRNDSIDFRNISGRSPYFVKNCSITGNKWVGSPVAVSLWSGMDPAYLANNNIKLANNTQVPTLLYKRTLPITPSVTPSTAPVTPDTPLPTAKPATSIDGTVVSAPGQAVVDLAQHVWIITDARGLIKDTVPDGQANGIQLLGIWNGGKVYQQAHDTWWSLDSTDKWVPATDPRTFTVPTTVPTTLPTTTPIQRNATEIKYDDGSVQPVR